MSYLFLTRASNVFKTMHDVAYDADKLAEHAEQSNHIDTDDRHRLAYFRFSIFYDVNYSACMEA